MNILITGAKGFVGRNLVEALKNIKYGKDKTRPNIKIEDIYEYDISSTAEDLNVYCKNADFVFNLAGVNRPKNQTEFIQGNFASSIQASLTGRYTDSEYGKSKKAGEELFFDYSDKAGAKVFIYRFPNLFGKWCRPNYNSVIATFCNNVASIVTYLLPIVKRLVK